MLKSAKNRLLTWAAALLVPVTLPAQTPTILGVVNSLSGEAKLSPGLMAQVHYTPITPTDLEHSSSLSYYEPSRPTVWVSVGNYGAFVQQIQADSSGGGIATILLPRDIAPGGTTLTIRNASGTSAPFHIVLGLYSPGLRTPWLNCQDGQQVGGFNAVGLGPTNPPSPSFGYPSFGEKFPTAATPVITVGGIDAPVLDSEGMPPYGVYYGSFQIPGEVPEGIQPVILTMGGIPSNSVNVVVGTRNGVASEPYSVPDGSVLGAAPESIVYAQSCSTPLSREQQTSDGKNPAATLGGTTVTVIDSAGVGRPALILSVAPHLVSYIVPPGTAIGRAQVAISVEDRMVSSSPLDIDTVQPGVFWPSGYLIRVRDGHQIREPLKQADSWFPRWEIDLGPDGDEVYLVVFATGLRHRGPDTKVSIQIRVIIYLTKWKGAA